MFVRRSQRGSTLRNDMAIVQLEKMTLYGSDSQKESVIDRLQELGCAHLVDLGPPSEAYGATSGSDDPRDALKFLCDCPEQRRQIRRCDNFDREQVVAEALRLQRDGRELSDERDELQKAIADLEPWGEFQLPADGAIGDLQFWFYAISLRDFGKIPMSRPPVERVVREVTRDHRNAYVVVLSREEPAGVPGTGVQLDRRPLSELRRRLEEVEEQLEEFHHRRAGLTRWCDLLAGVLDEADDAAARQRAMRQTLKGRNVYALRGWIPRDAADRIRRFAAENNLAVTIEPAAADEEPPTLLHNPESLAGSEGLVTFYKTPEYRAWDPSLIVVFSFAVFFAMILADAGYGVVLALITACYWKRMGKTLGGRRGRNVMSIVFGFTIVYGVVCGSYFGVAPSDESLFGKLCFLDAQDQQLMMPLTIAIGVVHLSLANIAAARLQRGKASALASFGWVAVMVGGLSAGVGGFAELGERAAGLFSQAGTILLVGGLIAVFLFSSQRPLLSLSFKTHALRVLDGLRGLTGLSSLFGDVLSYLRLFALGLAGGRLSATFNDLAASSWDSAGFGVIVAILIVVLGHTLNLVLSIMSGVVHGLRLNCIEFFNWGLPEEGYPFTTFAKKAGQP